MNIPFILIATIPMIIGLVWIYRSFRKELEHMDEVNRERIQHMNENFIPKMGRSRTRAQDDFLEAKIAMVFDRRISKAIQEVIYYNNSYTQKESELQDYLEHRFRAESDEYAMNKKIDKIKREYKLNK